MELMKIVKSIDLSVPSECKDMYKPINCNFNKWRPSFYFENFTIQPYNESRNIISNRHSVFEGNALEKGKYISDGKLIVDKNHISKWGKKTPENIIKVIENKSHDTYSFKTKVSQKHIEGLINSYKKTESKDKVKPSVVLKIYDEVENTIDKILYLIDSENNIITTVDLKRFQYLEKLIGGYDYLKHSKNKVILFYKNDELAATLMHLKNYPILKNVDLSKYVEKKRMRF